MVQKLEEIKDDEKLLDFIKDFKQKRYFDENMFIYLIKELVDK